MTSEQERLHGAENVALGRVLRRALSKAGAGFAGSMGSVGGSLEILDLACGTCREAGTLVEVFREFSGRELDVRLVGADIRDRELEEAAARARGAGRVGDRFEFLTENCAQIGRHQELGKAFDVTFLRHQNFWNDRPVWQRIFEQGLEKLKDDGLLVITSYFDREHSLAVQALEQAGAELLVTERNEGTRWLETPGKSVDRHVAIFRKRGGSGARG